MQDERFKSAATGLALTLGLWAAAVGLQLAFARPILEAIETGIDLNREPSALSAFRWQLATFQSNAAFLLIGYWLLTAIFGKGQLLEIRSANVFLVWAAFIWGVVMIIGSTVPHIQIEAKAVCPLLGISDTIVGFGFDLVSPCDVFVRRALKTVAFVLPTTLLAVSALLRIALSRRQWRSTPAG